MRDHYAGVDLVGQQCLDLHVAGGFAQLHLHVGPGIAEMAQHGGQDAVVGRADKGQRQRPHLAARQPLRQRRQRARLRQDAPHLHQPACPHRRQRHRALRAVEQRDAQLLLQRADLLRQRRLRHRQARGGTAEVQFLGNGHEVAELAQVHGFY